MDFPGIEPVKVNAFPQTHFSKPHITAYDHDIC